MRGIENGTSIVRQVSGGLSVVSDYRGKIQTSFDFFSDKEKFWTADVKFGHVPTIYTVIGDALAYISMLFFIAGILHAAIIKIKIIITKRKFRKKQKVVIA